MEKQNSNEPARENKDQPEREANEAIHAGLMEPEQGLSKDLREANF